jgi:hypothetical protein
MMCLLYLPVEGQKSIDSRRAGRKGNVKLEKFGKVFDI